MAAKEGVMHQCEEQKLSRNTNITPLKEEKANRTVTLSPEQLKDKNAYNHPWKDQANQVC